MRQSFFRRDNELGHQFACCLTDYTPTHRKTRWRELLLPTSNLEYCSLECVPFDAQSLAAKQERPRIRSSSAIFSIFNPVLYLGAITAIVSLLAPKTRKHPILWSLHQSMLHRIDPTILQMRRIIRLIPNVMLPEPALPYAAFLSFDMAGSQHPCGNIA